MYNKSKRKRKIIQRREFFETQTLPYLLTGIILFICFVIAVSLGVQFSSIGNMILWISVIGFIFGSLILDYLKTNIKAIIKWAFILVDLIERKLRKK